MITAYLAFNALIFVLAGVYCLSQPAAISHKLGFTALSHSGQSEFLAVYAGLQLGLAAFFAYVANEPQLHGLGLVFSLMLYAGIVPFRLFSLVRYAPVAAITKKLAAGETLLLLGAAALLMTLRN